jgi:vacuolar-type H+-ATPase subunit E/Vma4
MTDESEKLRRFKQVISDETEAQVKEMLEAAEKESREIVESARITADQRNKAKLRELENQSEQRLRREVSSAKLESHRNVLIKREQLADSVFEDVKRRLSEFRSGGSYGKWLKDTVAACTEKYPDSKAEVCLSPADMKYKDSLESASVIVTEDRSILLGGVNVRFADHSIVLDCTFDSMLEQERASFCNNTELTSARN